MVPFLLIGLGGVIPPPPPPAGGGYGGLGFWVGGIGTDTSGPPPPPATAGGYSGFGFWIGGIGADTSGPVAPPPAPRVVGWVGRRHRRDEFERELEKQRQNTFSRRWFDEFEEAQQAAFNRAEWAKSKKLKAALHKAVEAADEAFEQSAPYLPLADLDGLRKAVESAATAQQSSLAIIHAKAVERMAWEMMRHAKELEDDDEAMILLLS